jgi:DNA-binding SARP family transcriptional activator
MRFALLGPPVVAGDSGQQATLAGSRLRVLLAALLLNANTPVSAHALAEAVWDGEPPPAAIQTLRSYVRRLRRALGPHAGALIEARDPGYLIRLAGAELDVLEFETLCREAAAALRAAAWSQASDATTHALELWRGAPLPHATALDLASQTDNGYEQARAHHGLARAYQSAGQPGQARQHWQHALAEFTRLGTPEADQVRAELATAMVIASGRPAGAGGTV